MAQKAARKPQSGENGVSVDDQPPVMTWSLSKMWRKWAQKAAWTVCWSHRQARRAQESCRLELLVPEQNDEDVPEEEWPGHTGEGAVTDMRDWF